MSSFFIFLFDCISLICQLGFLALKLQDIRFLMDDIQELKPSMFCGVPRVYDRIYAGIIISLYIIISYTIMYIYFCLSKHWP
jgi:long-subunit acyl-CoA synthetase (AMP-forming)